MAPNEKKRKYNNKHQQQKKEKNFSIRKFVELRLKIFAFAVDVL